MVFVKMIYVYPVSPRFNQRPSKLGQLFLEEVSGQQTKHRIECGNKIIPVDRSTCSRMPGLDGTERADITSGAYTMAIASRSGSRFQNAMASHWCPSKSP